MLIPEDPSSSKPDNTRRWEWITAKSASSEPTPLCPRPMNKRWNCFLNSCRKASSRRISIAPEVPWFKFVTTISRPWEDAAWKGETGRVDDLVRKYGDLWRLRPETTTGYLCGHPSMCENGRG